MILNIWGSYMKTNQNKKKGYKITFIKKLLLVSWTRQFYLDYLFPATLITFISMLLIVSGVLAESYLWLGGVLFLASTVITLAILKHGIDKVWKDLFE